MEPPFLATELRKLLLWLTLECLKPLEENSFENGSIGLVELVVHLKTIENGRGFAQNGRGFSNFARASRARLYYNPPFRNPGSATGYRRFSAWSTGNAIYIIYYNMLLLNARRLVRLGAGGVWFGLWLLTKG